MKTYEISWRQQFEYKMKMDFSASSEKAAINKARKHAASINDPDDADQTDYSVRQDDGDDFNVENIING